MSTDGFYHEPVLKEEVCSYLITRNNGIYLDCTLGGGGHFRAIAERLTSEALLIGIDRDMDAINWNRNSPVSGPGVIIEQSRFSDFDSVLKKHSIGKIDGVLLDLGVSSFQIDSVGRGFTYMKESDLDMRMNPLEGIGASELIEQSTAEELASILEEYGEVHNANRMARVIKSCKFSLKTSEDLRSCLIQEYGPNLQIKVFAKVFQALRIAVNNELGELKTFLHKISGYLVSGGRLVIISYHSLEDRIVKEFIREQEQGCICPKQVPYCTCKKQVILKRVTKKAVQASDEEIKRNPRSRSARLRIAERISEVIHG